MSVLARLILCLVLCLGAHVAHSQRILVSGHVYESKNRSTLPGVTLTIQDTTTQKTVNVPTDSSGHFSLALSRNRNFMIRVFHPQYETFSKNLSTYGVEGDPVMIEIPLKPLTQSMTDQTKVNEQVAQNLREAVEVSTQKVEGREISGGKRNRVVNAGDLPLARDPKKTPKKIGFGEKAIHDKSVADAVGLTPHQKPQEPRTKRLPPSYGGFVIELDRVNRPLKSNHEIFSLDGPIYWEKLPTGQYVYLLGGFDSFDECSQFLREKVIHKYSDAKIIEFKKGTRLKS